MQIKKQQLELYMEQQTGSKSGREYIKAVYCHPAYLTYKQSKYIMQNARLDEAQAGVKIAGRNINNLRYADDTALMYSLWIFNTPVIFFFTIGHLQFKAAIACDLFYS